MEIHSQIAPYLLVVRSDGLAGGRTHQEGLRRDGKNWSDRSASNPAFNVVVYKYIPAINWLQVSGHS